MIRPGNQDALHRRRQSPQAGADGTELALSMRAVAGLSGRDRKASGSERAVLGSRVGR